MLYYDMQPLHTQYIEVRSCPLLQLHVLDPGSADSRDGWIPRVLTEHLTSSLWPLSKQLLNGERFGPVAIHGRDLMMAH